MALIDFMEKNIRGAWVIFGAIGMRQYYYYTKAEARKLYLEECRRIRLVCKEG